MQAMSGLLTTIPTIAYLLEYPDEALQPDQDFLLGLQQNAVADFSHCTWSLESMKNRMTYILLFDSSCFTQG